MVFDWIRFDFKGCLVTKVVVKDTSHWVDSILSRKFFSHYMGSVSSAGYGYGYGLVINVYSIGLMEATIMGTVKTHMYTIA